MKVDVSEIVKDENKIDGFIFNNFDKIDRPDSSKFSYIVNHKGNRHSFLFCTIPVLESWAFRQDTSYCFLLVIRNDSSLVESISKCYGSRKAHAEVSVEGNDVVSRSSFSNWHSGKLNIFLRGFRNLDRIPDLQNCSLAIIGNMDYSDIVYIAPKPF